MACEVCGDAACTQRGCSRTATVRLAVCRTLRDERAQLARLRDAVLRYERARIAADGVRARALIARAEGGPGPTHAQI